MRTAYTNKILKQPVNELFGIENTYHDTNATDKASHKDIASPSPAVLSIANIREKNPDRKKMNSTLQHLRTDIQSMMGEQRLHVLSLVYIHRYIP